MLRLFIAVELSSEVRGKLSAAQEKLKTSGARVRWVRPHQIHITLKFLGNVDETRVGGIIETVSSALQSCEPFTVTVAGAGTFPPGRRARVVWAGINKGDDKLIELQRMVEEACEKLGFNAEKRVFRPHFTLGRIKSGTGLSRLLQQMERYRTREFGRLKVENVSLIQSKLTPEGPNYTTLESFVLQGTGSDSTESVVLGAGRNREVDNG